MHLDLPQTVQLYTSYIRYRYYLEETLGLSPAPLLFHYPMHCPGIPSASTTSSSSVGGTGSNNHMRRNRKTAEVHNTNNNETSGGGEEEEPLPVPPSTPQQKAFCSNFGKARKTAAGSIGGGGASGSRGASNGAGGLGGGVSSHMYSESMDSELMAYR